MVTLVAALTPMIVAAIPGPGLPQVVVLILGGVLIGPQGPRDRRRRYPAGGQARRRGLRLFIPIFFVASGMALDVRSIIENPLRLLVFFVLLLVVRGLPSLLMYRRALPLRQRAEMTFITATTMPLLIALAAIGLSTGVMLPANAAAVVGAGVLSVLCYPLIAIAIARRGRTVPTAAAAASADLGVAGAGGVVSAARAAGEPSAVRDADAADDPGAPRLSSGSPLSVSRGWVRILQAGR